MNWRLAFKLKEEKMNELVSGLLKNFSKNGSIFKNKNYSLLWVGGGISLLGDWISTIAAQIYIYDVSNSVNWVVIITISYFLPNILFSPIAGVIIDKYDKKKILLLSELINSIIVFLIFFLLLHQPELNTNFIVIFSGLIFLKSFSSVFSYPTLASLIPEIVNENELVKANSIDNVKDNLSDLIGPLIAGFLLKVIGAQIAFLIDALSFFISSFMFAQLKVKNEKKISPFTKDEILPDLADGFKFLKGNSKVKNIIVLDSCVMLIGGAINMLLYIFIVDVFSAGAIIYGQLLALSSGIAIIISIFFSKIFQSKHMLSLYRVGIAILGITYLFFGMNKIKGLLYIFFCFIGIANACLQISLITILQELIPDEIKGRVFSIYITSRSLLSLVSIAGVSLILSFISVSSFYSLSGLFLLLILIINFILIRKE